MSLEKEAEAVEKIGELIRSLTGNGTGPDQDGNWQLNEFVVIANWTDFDSNRHSYTVQRPPTMPPHHILGLTEMAYDMILGGMEDTGEVDDEI